MKTLRLFLILLPALAVSSSLQASPPASDLCADALPISLGETVGSTFSASADGKSTCDSDLSPDVWYRYVGPMPENGLAIETESGFDTVVSIHARCPEQSRGREVFLVTAGHFVEGDGSLFCNDDAIGTNAALRVPPETPGQFLIRVAGRNPREQGVFRLRLGEAASITGEVVDRVTGDPISEGEVHLIPGRRTLQLDEEGKFSFFDLAPGAYRLSARSVSPWLNEVYEDLACPSDTAGEYRYCTPTRGTRVIARIEETHPLRLELDLGGMIRGQVLDRESGEPVADATVRARRNISNFRHLPETQTDGDGRFELSGLLPAEYYLEAFSTRHLRAAYPNHDCGIGYCPEEVFGDALAVTVASGETVSEIDISLDPRSGFSGRILDAEDATPVRDALVEVYQERDLLRAVPVEEDGSYRVGGLEPTPESYRVVVRSISHRSELYGGHHCVYPDNIACDASESNPLFLPSGQVRERIDFRLNRFPTISGRVTSAATGEPLEGIGVQVITNYRLRQVHTDEDGRYRLEGLVPGLHFGSTFDAAPWVNVHLDGQPCVNCLHSDSEAVNVIFAWDVEGVDLELELGGTITGRATDAETGLPVPEVKVELRGGLSDHRRPLNTTETDLDGRYSFSGLPEGDYFLQVLPYSPGRSIAAPISYRPQTFASCNSPCQEEQATAVSVTRDSITSDVDFVLVRPSGLSGTVRGLNGEPLMGVEVRALPKNSHRPASQGTTDHRGFYSIFDLVPGEHFVVADGSPDVLWPDHPCTSNCDLTLGTPVNVAGDGAFTPNIDFDLSTNAIIQGTVTDQVTGEPLAGIRVDAWISSVFNWYADGAFTDSEGRYRLDVVPGDYLLSTDNGPLGGISEIYDDIPCETGSLLLGNCSTNRRLTEVHASLNAPAIADFDLMVSSTPRCSANEDTLCLINGRFKVEIDRALEIRGESTAPSTQLEINVIDACDQAPRRFAFSVTGQTPVKVTLTVTDTWTGQEKVYVRRAGRLFEPIFDADAFTTCDAVEPNTLIKVGRG